MNPPLISNKFISKTSLIFAVIKEGNLLAEIEEPFGSLFEIQFDIHIEKYFEETKNVFKVIFLHDKTLDNACNEPII